MRNFFRLPPAERRLLLKTVLLMAATRFGLSFLSFSTLRRLTGKRMVRGDIDAGRPAPVERIAWCVRVASRYIPRATCLTQALTAQMLMVRRGYRVELCIGVARDAAGAFNAHAWVVHEGRVVVGEAGYEEFTPLPQVAEKLR